MFFMQENYFELINTCFLDIRQRNNSELFSWLCNQSESRRSKYHRLWLDTKHVKTCVEQLTKGQILSSWLVIIYHKQKEQYSYKQTRRTNNYKNENKQNKKQSLKVFIWSWKWAEDDMFTIVAGL